MTAAIDVQVVQEEHGRPGCSISQFSRVGVLGTEASGGFKLPVEDESDDGCSGRDVSKR